MRKIWIWLLTFIMYFIGYSSIGCLITTKEYWGLIFIIPSLLIASPAINFWNKYFDNLLK